MTRSTRPPETVAELIPTVRPSGMVIVWVPAERGWVLPLTVRAVYHLLAAEASESVIAKNAPAITNTAFIDVQGYQTISRTATIIANAYSVYLPLMLREDVP